MLNKNRFIFNQGLELPNPEGCYSIPGSSRLITHPPERRTGSTAGPALVGKKAGRGRYNRGGGTRRVYGSALLREPKII